jgi:hypothetical protein
MAANAAVNPAVSALNYGYEAWTGLGMQSYNSGETLSGLERAGSVAIATVSAAATVGIAVGGAGAISASARTGTQVTLTEGQYLNRVWDSRWTPGSQYSGPFGGSYSPSGALPINTTTAIETRGLNIPGVLNNAGRGGVYSVTRDIPAISRNSIGGTEPELLVSPQYRQYLNLIDQSISNIPKGR